MTFYSTQAPSPAINFSDYPVYPEANLWTCYHPLSTTFRLWSPVAEEAALNLYDSGDGGQLLLRASLEETQEGLWVLTVQKDLRGVYYTYQVKVNGIWLDETPGIYALAVGVNGRRAMVIDLPATDPAGWENDKGPTVSSPNEAVLYEVHVRDLTVSQSAGSSSPGKFLGLVEQGTTNPDGLATGIDHLKEFGVTHIHLLPAFDFNSVDEAALDRPQYNWGYDPQNYNVPEGSYASDPYRAEVRVREFKEMVQGFHRNGLSVVMDVVYNHTGVTEGSNFNLESPGYYYRHTDDGRWSDASACGNETASERIMMRKFILESCCHWAREYHIDGFRFDLMGIHDIETMNHLAVVLKSINPNILLYGEGWTAGPSPLPDTQRATKAHTHELEHISAFSDDLRDALKGSVFDDKGRGFVSGAGGMEEKIKFGVVGSIAHPEVHAYLEAWARAPWQAVSYVSCHDNHTLYDKLRISNPDASEEDIKRMHLLANAVVLTSQGMPFMMAGEEMLRTKKGAHNSYNLPDAINQIDWNWKTAHQDVFAYYKNLIQLRKAHPALRMPTAEMVNQHLHFVATGPGVVGYMLTDHANNDSWRNIAVFYNANKFAVRVALAGAWRVVAAGAEIDFDARQQVQDFAEVPPIAMLLLFQD